MKRLYQVFVSSTYEDLKDERRLVTEQILNLGHIPVGMELFQASNDDQWTHISRRIDACDYYIVIVAERYGSVLSDGTSYTEREYRYAIEHNIPTAAFLLSEPARGSWPQKHAETSAKERITAFRQLCEQKLVKHWDNANDLALKVTNSLVAMFDHSPRRGLVPAPDSDVIPEEIARLSDENRRLRAQLTATASEKHSDPKERELVDALKGVTVFDCIVSRQNTMRTSLMIERDTGRSMFELLLQFFLSQGGALPSEYFQRLVVEMATGLPPSHTLSGLAPTLAARKLDQLGLIELTKEISVKGQVILVRLSALGERIVRDELGSKAILLAPSSP